MPVQPTDVSGALIVKDGRILIALRPAGKHVGGCWEFPGGKVEPGETAAQSLKRELKEEFNITATIGREFARNIHLYDETHVQIIAFLVESYEGEIQKLEHDEIRWIDPKDLLDYKLAPADIPIAEKLMEFL